MNLSSIELSGSENALLASQEKSDRTTKSAPRSPRHVTFSQTRNWRQIVCDTLNISSQITDDDLEHLLEDRTLPTTPAPNVFSPQPAEPSYKTLHRIACKASRVRRDGPSLWVDEPFLVEIDDTKKDAHLSGKDGVSGHLDYMDKHEATFLIIKEYSCCGNAPALDMQDRSAPYSETLVLNSEQLCKALNHIQNRVIDGINSVSAFETRVEKRGLEPWLYCFQEDVVELAKSNNDKEVECFIAFVNTHKVEELNCIRETLSKGKVTKRLLPYLFVPYQVCILNDRRGCEFSRGVRLNSWPQFESSFRKKGAWKTGKSNKVRTTMKLSLFQWDFDGHFYQSIAQDATFDFDWNGDEPLDIIDFRLIPYNYAETTAQSMLRKRGQMIWSCRHSKFVSYSGYESSGGKWFIDSRFMIDCKTFQYTQPKAARQTPNAGVSNNLGPVEMKDEEPPRGDFVLLLPVTLMGFDIQEKEWKSLVMCRVREVDWDNEAFHCLVLPEDTKDVIKALVTHRVTQSKSSDLIRSKGSGLILLFHGPPGTGKTLTAESVAEHARKPLYRVTCGDIGTQPEAVEQYLKRVLGMAKLWNCVVLLDEAEVFLQERSLKDLQRNALVSVFLRVLEYYDGILILTSNRVGTLDEGFRSRIQLALEYPKLDRVSRCKIWENFIQRLNDDPTVSGELDIADLRNHLADLSKYELNGREIRNAINVARPLALSGGDKVDFQSLKKVMGVQGGFYRYIKDMNEGLDDDKMAREEGKR
ncbi:AAA family ATPase [Colletotrichum asianum]|uniref:AAA family ATPase n=1 Tax=Colletotrichum asianum TaxID=702518 RepID=A0A8H3WNG6_9PEZI|nr:AAA family ATPase [Colletotrichum asianum]